LEVEAQSGYGKTVLLTVDDDAEVLRAVERDLRREYGNRFRVLRADSGEKALDALRQLKLRNDPVALLLVDQRMPKMSGVEFIEQANAIYPEAKRALLTAYADTEAAIGAINKARVDYYLMKPWDPPEENFYPVLNDLLDDWMASFHPPFEGIRVLGHRWSPQALEIKSFLAGNHVPYQWLDVEADAEAERLLEGAPSKKLPLVVFPDGEQLEAPGALQIAEKVGLRRLFAHWRPLGASAIVPDLRPRWLLRFFAEQTCDEALPRDKAPAGSFLRAGRRLDVVLRRRSVL